MKVSFFFSPPSFLPSPPPSPGSILRNILTEAAAHIEIQVIGRRARRRDPISARRCSRQRRPFFFFPPSLLPPPPHGATCATAMQEMKYIGVGQSGINIEEGDFFSSPFSPPPPLFFPSSSDLLLEADPDRCRRDRREAG